MKFGKTVNGSQRARKVDIANKAKVLELVKKEDKNEFLSWDLMTRLYAHIFNTSKHELIDLSEEEQKGEAIWAFSSTL